MNFSQLPLSTELLKAIDSLGYTQTTEVQKRVIPLILERRELLVEAQTGSGKSASFAIPLLEMWQTNRDEAKKGKIKVLVLAPSRELALQIAQTFELLSKYLKRVPRVVTLIGGEKIGEQLFEIQKGCDILVATSGRFLDVLRKKQMNLSHLDYLVLDEADKMLNLDFSEEIELLLEALPSKRQTLLFSATYPQKIVDIAAKIVSDPLEIKIQEEIIAITQRAIEVDQESRGPLLRTLLEKHAWRRVLVFMANKRSSDNIAQKFRKYGIVAASFNGDLDQEMRNTTLNAFKEGKVRVLFATDIAARGLHIEDVDCVINYDLPRATADYTHRVGRTARAGKSGEAISFINHENMEHFKLIEKRSGIELKREVIEGFELKGEALAKTKGAAPIKGKKKSKKDKLREQEAKNI